MWVSELSTVGGLSTEPRLAALPNPLAPYRDSRGAQPSWHGDGDTSRAGRGDGPGAPG